LQILIVGISERLTSQHQIPMVGVPPTASQFQPLMVGNLQKSQTVGVPPTASQFQPLMVRNLQTSQPQTPILQVIGRPRTIGKSMTLLPGALRTGQHQILVMVTVQ